MNLEELMSRPPFGDPRPEELLEGLRELTELHRERCPAYARLTELLFNGIQTLADVPYLPVSLFKSHRLVSVSDEQVFKTLTSSGTTGGQVSRVELDRPTADLQSRALARIMTDLLGPKRLPMLIVDSPQTVRGGLNARTAGILGMLTFGHHHTYVLDEEMRLDETALRAFLERYADEPFLIFGFTFMVWEHFFRPLETLGVDLSQGILVHTGGWKKLVEKAVTNQVFRDRFRAATGLHRIHNFYGMAEQVGSVFLEGESGLRAPLFGGVLIRDARTLAPLPPGQQGVVQVLSLLPRSYPGHSLLTEDLGVLHEDGSFSVQGRVPKAELRGCSDVFAYSRSPS